MVPFQVSLSEAGRVFDEWHASKWFSPGKLLSQGRGTLKPVLLPFWLFEAAVNVEYTGSIPAQATRIKRPVFPLQA